MLRNGRCVYAAGFTSLRQCLPMRFKIAFSLWLKVGTVSAYILTFRYGKIQCKTKCAQDSNPWCTKKGKSTGSWKTEIEIKKLAMMSNFMQINLLSIFF